MSETKSGIGYSPLSGKVYMGKQNQTKGMWIGKKTDVTNQFIDIAFLYFEENTFREIKSEVNRVNLFINIKKDKESIQKLINNLTETISSL